VELVAACRAVAEKFAAEFAAAECTLEIESASLIRIAADPTHVRIVLSELLRNGLEAVGERGRVVVSVSTHEQDGAAWGILRVCDNGRGLSATDREHLFDPFYSGRQAGRGLGFGLSKAWRIVTLHGGRIEVDSPPQGGATFTIHWPAVPNPHDDACSSPDWNSHAEPCPA
jgi:signal transduction histidine kinase